MAGIDVRYWHQISEIPWSWTPIIYRISWFSIDGHYWLGLIPVLCYIFWGTQHRLLREQEIVFDHYQKWVGSWYVNATLYKATGGIIMLMKYVRSMSVIGKPRERERIWMKDILRDCSMTITNSEFLFNHLNEEVTQFCFVLPLASPE